MITALQSDVFATLTTPASPVLGGDSQQRLVSRHVPKRINNFSGGLCSFWSAWRDVQQVGPENVVLLFADTLVESDDLYQFLKDASALLGVPVTRVSREITPWQLFRQERMIGNNKYPICSVKLKREVLDGWMMAHYEMNRDQSNMLLPKATLSIGFDWTEEHRTQDMRNEHPMWDIRAPMQEGEIWDKCRMEREAAKLGLKIADAYVQGFPHNNCGKRCVRAGISHWVHLYHTDRRAYMSWAVEEWDCKLYLETLGIMPLSMLKDRRGGETNNLYLLDLKKRIDAGEQFDKHEWGGCGCGGASAMPANAAGELQTPPNNQK